MGEDLPLLQSWIVIPVNGNCVMNANAKCADEDVLGCIDMVLTVDKIV